MRDGDQLLRMGNPDYNPGLYGDAAAAAGNTATATAAVLEAAGVDKLSCVGIMKCMATTLASTSLAPAGTVVEWGQLSWTSNMDPTDRQAAENEGICTILTSGRGFLIETHAGTVSWAGIGQRVRHEPRPLIATCLADAGRHPSGLRNPVCPFGSNKQQPSSDLGI